MDKESKTPLAVNQKKDETATNSLDERQACPVIAPVNINKEETATPLATPTENIHTIPQEKTEISKRMPADNIREETPVLSEEHSLPQVISPVVIAPTLQKPMMDDDVKLIICVILAIFIPPLGMYLWDKNTDTWFVVDLILFLCWFLLILGPFGLLALLSIVIALLRVFGLL